MDTSQKFLSNVKGKSGVYIITSSDIKNSLGNIDDQILVKIGLAGDLDHRFNSYLLYWPNGIYIYDIFYTTKQHARQMEKSIHEYLNKKAKYIVAQHSHTEEWFQLSSHEIDKLVNLIKRNKTTLHKENYLIKTKKGTTNLKGKLVFPYRLHERVHLLITANLTKGTDRIKPMSTNLKILLDKKLIKSPVRTEIKKPKKSNNNLQTSIKIDWEQ
jgi:hypothetical protein